MGKGFYPSENDLITNLVIAGRVEARDTEESAVYFFVAKDGIWSPHPSAPVFRLQDPFVTRIGDEIIFGGVETFPHPSVPGALGWRTNLYRGTTLAAREPPRLILTN